MTAPLFVSSIVVLSNPCPFLSPFEFQITCVCSFAIKEEVEWKLVYIGSAGEESCDQTLDSILVGPIPVGTSKFVFSAPAPNADLIPEADLVGATVVLLIGLYKEREFLRIGYYVNVDYGNNEAFNLQPPSPPKVDLLQRNVLADKPIVTKFDIPWDDEEFEKKLLQEKLAKDEEEALIPEDDVIEEDDDEEDDEDVEELDDELEQKMDQKETSKR